MSRSLSAGVFLAVVLLAAALRLPALATRPMHADEAIHAAKFGALLEGRGYAYDPSEYHGPTLYYLTLLPAWLRGEGRYVEIDEVTLRCVPALLGVALVAAHLAARSLLGAAGAAVAALLAAISPAMVFYSRYYIHEMPLVFFSFGLLLGAGRYLRAPGAGAALVAGASAGLMLATKETAIVAIVSVALAFGATGLWERWRRAGQPALEASVRARDLLVASLAAVLVAGLAFSSFLTRPGGVLDALRAYGPYLTRAGAASVHVHPWDYYLRLLVHVPSRETPVWGEGLILLLALVGGAAGWVGRAPFGADARVLRLLGFYTLLMLGCYSAIPYKTPWCLLGFLHGMVLLAGAGAVALVCALPGRASRAAVCLLLLATAGQLGWQAFSGSFLSAADPRNPYVYAQTGNDALEIASRLRALAEAGADGPATRIQVVSRENLWPLPWYLRGLSRVEWWNGISETVPSAPVVVITPDMEPALVRKLYELPPPGERELYVSAFERPLELRPRVELRAYAAKSLWDAFLAREPGPAPPPRSEPR